MTDLYKKMNYKTPVKYFLNTYIREYDLSKANISSLLFRNRITQSEYDRFLRMDKKNREVSIGLMIRNDGSIYKDIQSGIIEAKRLLCESNDLDDFDIVTIKNDAIFVCGKDLKNTIFPPFEFKIKNTYNVYLQLADLEIFYGDSINADGSVNTTIDVKGIPDNTLILHQGGMLDIICNVCYKLQREDIGDTTKWLCGIYEDFVTRKLPLQCYRNFDSYSGFTFNTFINKASIPEIDESMIEGVDINRNLLILRDLMSIITDIYSRYNR